MGKGGMADRAGIWKGMSDGIMVTIYPAILGIILAVLVILGCVYIALRCLSCCCCDCLSGGRYHRKNKYKYADLHSSPYQQQAPPPPPGYHEQQPPMYAQFDAGSGRRRGDDSLPAMPTWKEAGERRVYEEEDVEKTGGTDVEMERLHGEKEREARLPMLPPSSQHRDPAPGFSKEMDPGSHGGGDLGQGQAYVPYQPFVQGYRPYGEAFTPQAEKGQAGGNAWRDV
ncbi:MAG: hypothetical protein Q9212_005471 [Teloschistes hypoglaucus]